MPLSPDEKHRFASDGFVALPGFLNDAELLELQERLHELIVHRLDEIPQEHVFYEDRSQPDTLKQLQQIWQYDTWLERIFKSGKFRQLAEHLLDGPVVPKNLQWFNKPPNIGQPTPAHQDGYYFMLTPCSALTMWLALDHVDEENGCVRYVRGSHLDGMRQHGRSNTLGFSQTVVDFGEEEMGREFAAPAKPGDLLAHDALTIHRADGNQSVDRNRRALGFIYYSQRAKEDVVAQKAYQRRLADEMKAAGKL